jgi:hypothetical protein
MDKIKKYVDQAHKIFSDTSVFEFEVFDSNRQSAVNFLNQTYNHPEDDLIDRYLEVVSKLQKFMAAAHKRKPA